MKYLIIFLVIVLIIIGAYYLGHNNISMPAPGTSVSPVSSGSTSGSQSGGANQGGSQTGGNSSGSQTGGNVGSGGNGSPTSVSGMQRYTDSEIGFSFWYPNNWQVVRTITDQNVDGNITNGTVLAHLSIGPVDQFNGVNPQLLIQEVHSPGSIITDGAYTGIYPTYFFNYNTHTWMAVKVQGQTRATTTADVSLNTMGGLHMLGLNQPNNSYVDKDQLAIIIPLSGQDFLVVNKIGTFDPRFLAQTIVALNPAVATPVSTNLQIATIRNAATVYSSTPNITWKTLTDAPTGVTLQYPGDFGNYGADLNGGTPQVITSPTGDHIDDGACYMDANSPTGNYSPQHLLINNVMYCLTTSGDVGMGQLYRSYNYTTNHNGLYITVTYTIHTSNGCGPIVGLPQYVSCQYFQNNYNNLVLAAITQSMNSLKYTK